MTARDARDREPPSVGERRAFFSPRALATYLDLSERTVRQMLADGVIPSYRFGGARRIDPADVDAYVARNREAPRRVFSDEA